MGRTFQKTDRILKHKGIFLLKATNKVAFFMAEEKKFIEATEIKDLKSNTNVTAVHIKWNKQHYHVVKAFHGRIGWMLSGFHATNRGLPIHNKLIFFFMGDDVQDGIDHMLKVLNGLEEPKKQSINYR